MRGYPYRTPRCRVCGKPAFGGSQSRPLCIHCEQREAEIHELLTDEVEECTCTPFIDEPCPVCIERARKTYGEAIPYDEATL